MVRVASGDWGAAESETPARIAVSAIAIRPKALATVAMWKAYLRMPPDDNVSRGSRWHFHAIALGVFWYHRASDDHRPDVTPGDGRAARRDGEESPYRPQADRVRGHVRSLRCRGARAPLCGARRRSPAAHPHVSAAADRLRRRQPLG